VYYSDPFGTRLAVLPFLSLNYTLAVNAIGTLTVALPTSFNTAFLRRDCRIEVWRSVDGGAEYLEGEKHWLLRRWTVQIRDNGARTIALRALCPNDLLRRRIIAYDAGSSFSTKTGTADDLIKQYARDNLITIDATRDVSGQAGIGSLMSVQGNITQAVSVSVSAARDNLYETIRKLAEASATGGTYLAFDVIWNGATFELRTYTGQRGVDHRFPGGLNPVILGPDFGNMVNVDVDETYEDEHSVVIAGGQGTGDARTIATATDSTRVGASPFNHIEEFAQANNSTDSTQVADIADARLRAGRPVRTVSGTIQDTPGTRYGVHWAWGDRVTVQVDNINQDARIDAVSVSVEGGKETIDARIRTDD
jgi:hypothetical protein